MLLESTRLHNIVRLFYLQSAWECMDLLATDDDAGRRTRIQRSIRVEDGLLCSFVLVWSLLAHLPCSVITQENLPCAAGVAACSRAGGPPSC